MAGDSLPTGPFLNAEAIYKGLLAMGLSTNAAAGVAGNIYQESHGNPSIGAGAGGGLFGELVSNGGSSVGGSLAEQLSALAKYIATNGSIADINAHASTATAAADYFESKYERPSASAANLPAREDAANWVIAAAKSGDWGTSAGSSGTTPTDSSGGTGIDWDPNILSFFTDANHLVTLLMWIVKPSSWVRIAALLIGVLLLLFAITSLIRVGEGESPIPPMPNIVPVPV